MTNNPYVDAMLALKKPKDQVTADDRAAVRKVVELITEGLSAQHHMNAEVALILAPVTGNHGEVAHRILLDPFDTVKELRAFARNRDTSDPALVEQMIGLLGAYNSPKVQGLPKRVLRKNRVVRFKRRTKRWSLL